MMTTPDAILERTVGQASQHSGGMQSCPAMTSPTEKELRTYSIKER